MRRIKSLLLAFMLVSVSILGVPGFYVVAGTTSDYEEIVLPLEFDVECYNYPIKLVNSEEVSTFTINGSTQQTEYYLEEEGEYDVIYYSEGNIIGESTVIIDLTAPVFYHVIDGVSIPRDYTITFRDNFGVSLFTYYCEATGDYGYIQDIEAWTPHAKGVYELTIYDYAGNFQSIILDIGYVRGNLQVTGVQNNGKYEAANVNISVKEGYIYYMVNDGEVIGEKSKTARIPFLEDGQYNLVVADDYGNYVELNFTILNKEPIIYLLAKDGSTTPVKVNEEYGSVCINKETKFRVEDPTLDYLSVDSNEKTITVSEKNEFTLNEDGLYRITAIDSMRKRVYVDVIFDSVAPTTKLVNGGVYTDTVYVSAEDIHEYSCYINGQKVNEVTCIYTEGYYDITFVDIANNTTSLRIQVVSSAPKPTTKPTAKPTGKPKVDKKPPTVPLVISGCYFAGPATIKFYDESGIKSAMINGITVQSGVKVTKTGTYYLVVTDKKGNVTKRTFHVDMKAPTIKGVSHNKVYKGNVKISISDDTKISMVSLDSNYFLNGSKVTKPGKHTLYVEDYASRSVTTVFYIDKSAPKVSGVKNKAVYRKAVKVKFTDDTGIKTLTLNGKKFKNNSTIKKKGKYTLVAVDKASRKTTVSFTIK